MTKFYLVAVALFTISELLVRTAGRRLSSAQRTRMRRLTLVSSVTLPLVIGMIPLPSLLPSALTIAPYQEAFDLPISSTPLAAVLSRPPADGTNTIETTFSWSETLTWLLVIGWLVATTRVTMSSIKLRRFLGGASPWGQDDRVDVFTHPAAPAPFATLISGRPLIVLPRWMLDDPEQTRIAIAHERRHLKNRDPHWALGFTLWSVFLWWHPLIASWRRRIELDQEIVCDAMVLKDGIDRRQYWQTLVAVAARLIDTPLPQPAQGMLGRPRKRTNDLERRIIEMSKPNLTPKTRLYITLAASLFAMQAWVACGSLHENTSTQALDAQLGELPAQELALRVLKQGLLKSGANAGRVIVSHSATGQIVASGGFDRDGTPLAPGSVLRDPVTPASLAKPVLVAAALENKETTPDTNYDTSVVTVLNSGDRIRDYAPLGTLTTGEIVAKSSNIGATQIARSLPLNRASETLSRFGLEQLGGSPLTDPGHLALGLGSAQPLRLLRFYEAAQQGGEVVVEPSATCGGQAIVERIMSAQTSDAVRVMLRRVVSDGTGRLAASDFQAVGGKTATWSNAASFVGVMPRLAVWVMLEGDAGLVGGRDAAPIVRDIMDAIQTEDLFPDC